MPGELHGKTTELEPGEPKIVPGDHRTAPRPPRRDRCRCHSADARRRRHVSRNRRGASGGRSSTARQPRLLAAPRLVPCRRHADRQAKRDRVTGRPGHARQRRLKPEGICTDQILDHRVRDRRRDFSPARRLHGRRRQCEPPGPAHRRWRRRKTGRMLNQPRGECELKRIQ